MDNAPEPRSRKKAVMASRSTFYLDRLHVELSILCFPGLNCASEGILRTAAKGNVHERKFSRKHLNICHLNARSLKNKLTEVKLIALEYDVDIIAVSETWFDSLTSPADTSLVGFQAPRRDRADTKRGGGVCIYVKEYIACIRRLDLEPTDVEIVVIEVFIQSTPWGQQKSSWIIACCYRPPSAGLDKVFLELFERIASSTVRYKALFVGDFNAKNTFWWPGDTTVIHQWTRAQMSCG